MTVNVSYLEEQLDRLVLEHSLAGPALRQVAAVLVKFDQAIQGATVSDLCRRRRGTQITAHECEATARRIIAARNAGAHACKACDGTGWKWWEGPEEFSRGSVSPCQQCQRDRAQGWRTETAGWKSTDRSTIVNTLTPEERAEADRVAEGVKNFIRGYSVATADVRRLSSVPA